MPSKKFPWFRLYANDMLGDRKIKRIYKITGISIAEIRGAWLTLLCLASESPERGKLLFDGGIPYDYDDLVEECGIEALKFHTIFTHFSNMRMVSFDEVSGIYDLPSWNKRQPIGDTTGAERVARHRKNKKQSVTLPKRYSNALEEEEESEEEPVEATAVVFSHFQNEICMLTPALADKVGGWIDEYPHDWITKAIDIAVLRSKRRTDYIEGILRNWKNDGFDDGVKKSKSTADMLQEAGYNE